MIYSLEYSPEPESPVHNGTYALIYSPEQTPEPMDIDTDSPDPMDIDSPSYAVSLQKRKFDQISSPEDVNINNQERSNQDAQQSISNTFAIIVRSIKSVFNIGRTFFRSPNLDVPAPAPAYRQINGKRQRLTMPGAYPISPTPVKRIATPPSKRIHKPLSSPIPFTLPVASEAATEGEHVDSSYPVVFIPDPPTNDHNSQPSETNSQTDEIIGSSLTHDPTSPTQATPDTQEVSNSKYDCNGFREIHAMVQIVEKARELALAQARAHLAKAAKEKAEARDTVEQAESGVDGEKAEQEVIAAELDVQAIKEAIWGPDRLITAMPTPASSSSPPRAHRPTYRPSCDNAFSNSINSTAGDAPAPRPLHTQARAVTPSKPVQAVEEEPAQPSLRDLADSLGKVRLNQREVEKTEQALAEHNRLIQEKIDEAERAAAAKKALEEEQERKRIAAERAAARRLEKLNIGVDAEWQQRIDAALNTKDYYSNVTPGLTRKDLGTLLPTSAKDTGGWLNDEIVMAYLNKIADKINDEAGWTKRSDRPPPVHVMSSHLHSTYRAKGYQGVERWAQRAKVGGERLLKVESLLIPICTGNHWTLLCVSGTNKTISYYDSLHGNAGTYTAWAKQYVSEVLGDKFVADEWIISATISQRQENLKDCGVFVCLNGHALLDSREPTRMYAGPSVATRARNWVAAVLLGKEI